MSIAPSQVKQTAARYDGGMNSHDAMIRDAELEIEGAFVGTEMPIEAFGTIAGRNWYFRARFDYWEFAVALDPAVPPDSIYSSEQGFYRCNPEPLHSAGTIPLADAVAIIHGCVREFRDENSPP